MSGSVLRKIPWESARKQWHYLPNILSYLRIAAFWIPAALLVAGFHEPLQRSWAALAFFVIAATDGIDGWIARRFNLMSAWGAFIDPIADKILVVATFAALCWVYSDQELGWIMISSTFFFVARELIVSYQIARVQKGVVPPTRIGKLKTVAQMAMIIAWMVPFELMPWGREIIAFCTVSALIVTLLSWMDYYQLYISKTRKIEM